MLFIIGSTDYGRHKVAQFPGFATEIRTKTMRAAVAAKRCDLRKIANKTNTYEILTKCPGTQRGHLSWRPRAYVLRYHCRAHNKKEISHENH
jgi:hypothetical protein